MPLGKQEFHHWMPVPAVMDWLTNSVIKPKDLVIDVGCGHVPFPRANIGVDRFSRDDLKALWKTYKTKATPETVQCDFGRHPLPFKDKEVDFVYCRHTLEDLFDPFLLISEMQRVGKAGYIETPSPLAELTRGIDGFLNSELWRGYYHHRFFVWVKDGTLTFISKFPLIEHFTYNEGALEEALRRGDSLWNTYYLWTDEIKVRHMEDPFDYKFYEDYQLLLWHAVLESTKSTEDFCQMVNKQVNQAA
jgi:hypothetical protein